jgi:hypothetical protein
MNDLWQRFGLWLFKDIMPGPRLGWYLLYLADIERAISRLTEAIAANGAAMEDAAWMYGQYAEAADKYGISPLVEDGKDETDD